MKHAPVAVALALAGALVAGCGGGDSVPGDSVPGGSIPLEDYSALEQRLAAAEQAQKEARESARGADQRADDEVADIQAQIEMERNARAEAEGRFDDIEEELGSTVDVVDRDIARQVSEGLDEYIYVLDIEGAADHFPTKHVRRAELGTADPTVTPRYDESASVSTSPEVAFQEVTSSGDITGDTNGDWFRTSFSNHTADFTDRLDVYTDAEAPKSVPFASVYNRSAGEKVVPLYNPTYDPADPPDFPANVIDHGKVAGSILLAGDFTNDNMDNPTPGDRDDATAKLFPKSGEPAKDFDQIDRGADRNMQRYPLQYNAEVKGELGGAEGMFTCASAAETDCRVTNQNNHFRFGGPWVFTPSDANVEARVDDGEFTYFGWWTRTDHASGTWTFRTFFGPYYGHVVVPEGNRMIGGTPLQQLTGTATYRGPASGYYAIYPSPLYPEQSEYGEFSATATIIADFGDEVGTNVHASGTIDQFDNHPDWTLTLLRSVVLWTENRPSFIYGSTGKGYQILWSIGDGYPVTQTGQWQASFYSNLPFEQRSTEGAEYLVPDAVVGIFSSEYQGVMRLAGAFGTHRVDD